MSKFEVGQEVIFTHGDLKDVMGVVIIPLFQLSQSDWPEVVVQYEDDRRFFVDIDKVRPAEDPYEYNIQATDTDDGDTFLCRRTWEPDTEVLERWMEGLNESVVEMRHTYKMVKRRKAGKVEDV